MNNQHLQVLLMAIELNKSTWYTILSCLLFSSLYLLITFHEFSFLSWALVSFLSFNINYLKEKKKNSVFKGYSLFFIFYYFVVYFLSFKSKSHYNLIIANI
eukprot:TRINITY_DN8436_c1_g1_i1.p1 TRINITY_DN8436_c1_g1~~TRINITY_DN8436_c1_g1_i1.p1  ORF type:complete len:101 (-),score=0.41 TRINITY_DN8436_c1_g1_i1:529-831(-)